MKLVTHFLHTVFFSYILHLFFVLHYKLFRDRNFFYNSEIQYLLEAIAESLLT